MPLTPTVGWNPSEARAARLARIVNETGTPPAAWMAEELFMSQDNYPAAVIDFCRATGAKAAPWMAWNIVAADWIGCTVCLEHKNAQCWGHVGCHGFFNGCGCWRCRLQEVRLYGAETNAANPSQAAELRRKPLAGEFAA